jgi:anti-anti-sigma factor
VSGELEVDHERGEVVVHPPRELDVVTDPVLDLLLSQAVALEPARVVVDLADVTYIDRHAVVTIAAAAQALRDGGRSLVVRHPSRAFLRLVGVLGDRDLAALGVEPEE